MNGNSKPASAKSLRRTSFKSREFRRPAIALDLDAGQLAEAGVFGVLNTFVCGRCDCGEAGDGEEEKLDLKGTLIDSPTQPGTLTASTIPGYSKPEVRPRPDVSGFHGSLNWEGEPMADEDTDAPDSDEADSTGGCSWNESDAEWGDAMGLV